MKNYLITLLFCLFTFISIAQVPPPPPPPPAILVGCEDAEETYTCAQEKLVLLAFEALQAKDVESIIKATELDIIFMNVQIEFGKNQKINPAGSFIKFHESEMKTFDVALSFAPEELPAEINPKSASTATVFKNYLFLKIDRAHKQLTPLPDYKPERIPFSGPEIVVIYPGCEDAEDNTERTRCLSQNVAKFIAANFNPDLASDLGLDGTNQILVSFVVNKEGNVENIRVNTPYTLLENEAIRVVKMLPQMQPATIENIPVKIRYALPIAYKVPEKKAPKKRNK